jgi:Carboxypeptidase regulatory-like domain
MRTYTALATVALLAASLVQTPLAAQARSSAAELRLRVVDQTGAVLPQATVTIYTLDGNPGITVTADEHGVASFRALPSGLSEIVARFPGFTPYIEGAKLKPGKNQATVALRLAPVTELVSVTATAEAESGS